MTLARHVLPLVVSILHGFCSAATEIECPTQMHLESGVVAAADMPPGFQYTISGSPIYLTGYNLYDGPPEHEAAMMPDKSTKNFDTWVLNWKSELGKWVSCEYAKQLIRVAHRVDDASQVCTARSKEVGDPKTFMVHFSCR